jgi:hypothetical protein
MNIGGPHPIALPPIFVGDVTEPTNIWDMSKSNRTTHIFISVPYIFIDLGNNKYNLNYIHHYDKYNLNYIHQYR